MTQALLLSMALLTPGMGMYSSQAYVAADIGLTIPPDTTVQRENSPKQLELLFENGFTGSVRGGICRGGLCFELALNSSSVGIDDVESTSSGTGGPVDISGQVDTWALTVDMLYQLFPSALVHPYIGLGAGVGVISIKNPESDGFVFFDPDQWEDDSGPLLTYQLFAGLRYELTRRLSAYVAYHYRGYGEFKISKPGPDPTFEMESHNAVVGVRITF